MRNVIVTGNSRGLGLAISRRVAADPRFRLIGLSRSLTPEYQALIDAAPDRVHHIRFDAADLDAIPGLVRGITAEFGPVWGLVNNAAIFGGMKLDFLITVPWDYYEKFMSVNLNGQLLMVRACWKSLFSTIIKSSLATSVGAETLPFWSVFTKARSPSRDSLPTNIGFA